MRALLLITDLERGGTPTIVRELAIRLRKAGGDVEVACLAPWGPVAAELRDAGVSVTALNARGRLDFRILPRLIRLIRQRKFTTVCSFLVHANTLAAAASLRAPGVRWIQSIQTTQPNPRWHWRVQQLAQKAADAIVVPSPSAARVAREWAGVPQEKIVVIPNAIDLTDWAQFQSSIPAANPRPYPVAFIGRLDPIKDLPTLIKSVAMLAPLVHLHVYGEGSDRPRVEKAIADTGGPVTMHGPIDVPQPALARAGLLVLPSLAEGFGLVLIEAMAAGVPVVATDVPGICDVVRRDETGLLVSPSDPAAMADTIRQMVEDCELRQRLIETAHADVRQRFTWQIVLEKYQRLLAPG